MHPYSKHNEQSVSKQRAQKLTSGYKSGGSVKHSDAAQDKKLIRSEFKKMERSEGEYKRGGAVKSAKTTININLPNQEKGPPPLPLVPPGPALMGGPPVPPGGAGPLPMKPPGMKSGGAVKMTAGAETGVGRLQKAKLYKK